MLRVGTHDEPEIDFAQLIGANYLIDQSLARRQA
jgi:hypothetical protein